MPGDEAERLAAIMAAAFTERDRGWSAAEFMALAETPGVTVFAPADGFAVLRIAGDEAEVLTIAVSPEAQGRGIGRRLLAEMLELAGHRRVILEVGQENRAALRLYESANFMPAGRRPAYLCRADGNREDALILEHLP